MYDRPALGVADNRNCIEAKVANRQTRYLVTLRTPADPEGKCEKSDLPPGDRDFVATLAIMSDCSENACVEAIRSYLMDKPHHNLVATAR